MRWNDEGYPRRTVFQVRKHRRHRSLGYKLAVLTAPVLLIPVFIVIVVAFCLIFAPLLYLATSLIILRSGWRSTEVEYWVEDR